MERYNGNDVNIVIPDPVIKIGERAFEGCAGIQSVIFPPRVTEIGGNAFSDCQSLNEIEFSNGLETIGDGAFCRFHSLKHINLPESIVYIYQRAFAGCIELKNIAIPFNVRIIGAWTFCGCQSLDEVRLSDGLEAIGDEAFGDCCSLKQIKLPETVKWIGKYAFRNCTNLEVINIPNCVECDDNYYDLDGVFQNCPSLREIIISEAQKERLFMRRGKVWARREYGAKYIFEEKVYDDNDEDREYSDKNCGSWYINFVRELREESYKKVQVNRRAEGKCPYCGGAFTGLFTKKCARCGKFKDY